MGPVKGCIDVTALDHRAMVREAFNQSRPQGLGILNHTPDPITEEELDQIMAPRHHGIVASADYTRGRSMKFDLYRQDDKIVWPVNWYDHDDAKQLAVLVAGGMTPEDATAAMEAAAAEIE